MMTDERRDFLLPRLRLVRRTLSRLIRKCERRQELSLTPFEREVLQAVTGL